MKINWKSIPEAIKVLGRFGEKHLPSILTGFGVAGFIGTAVLAAKEAPKAESAIKKEKRDKTIRVRGEVNYENELVELTLVEKVKTTAGYYWPSVALGTASAVCILSAHKIDLTRLASVTAAYQLSKSDLKDLKHKIIEKDGKEKLKEYEKDTHKDVLSNTPPSTIYNTGKGTTVFYDPTSGMLFYHDIWHVERALMRVLDACKNDGEYSLEEFRYDLDLPKNSTQGDYEFTYESMKDISTDSIHDLFEYHSIDSDNGDLRPCIWLDIGDRIMNICDYSGERRPFRRN